MDCSAEDFLGTLSLSLSLRFAAERAGVTPVTAAQMPDYIRVGNVMRQKPFNGLAD